MPSIPQAHEVHCMDSRSLRASIGLQVDDTKMNGEPAGRPLQNVDSVVTGNFLLHNVQTKSGYLDQTAVGTTTRLRRKAQAGSPLGRLPLV
jgi:hypothetical protein